MKPFHWFKVTAQSGYCTLTNVMPSFSSRSSEFVKWKPAFKGNLVRLSLLRVETISTPGASELMFRIAQNCVWRDCPLEICSTQWRSCTGCMQFSDTNKHGSLSESGVNKESWNLSRFPLDEFVRANAKWSYWIGLKVTSPVGDVTLNQCNGFI